MKKSKNHIKKKWDAAQFYFNKTPLELTKEESAKLISILDNPKEYDLVDKKENNERKAKVIIDKINKAIFIITASEKRIQKDFLFLSPK